MVILQKKKTILFLFIITVIGLILRIYNLAKFGFGYDEALQLIFIKLFPKAIFFPYVTIAGTIPIFFRILILGWMNIASNEYFLRFFSVIWAIFSIIGIYKLGEIIFSKRIGILSALILSISPLHIYYSQELTHRSLDIFFAISSSYCFFKFLKYKNRSSSILYVLSTLAFIYAYPLNLLIFLIQNIFFFTFYYKDKYLRRKWIVLQLIIFLLSLYWLIFIILQVFNFCQLNTYWWVPKPNFNTVLQTFLIFPLGYHASWGLQLRALIIFIYFSVTAIYYWRKKNEIFYLLFWLMAPIGIIWLISQLHPCYLPRIFSFSLPAFCLLMAAGMINIKKYLQRGLIALYIILTIYSLSNYYENKLPQDYQKRYPHGDIWPKRNYKEPAIYVAEKFKDGDIILHVSRISIMPFIYYHGGKLPEYGIKINDIYYSDWWFRVVMMASEKNTKFCNLLKFLEIKEKSDLNNYKRIWLIHSSWRFSEETLPEDREGNRIIDWFNKNFSKKEIKMFGGVNIYLFSS